VNVIISIGRCNYLLPQADAIKVMTAMTKAVRVEEKYSRELIDEGDYRTRYIVIKRDRILIAEVDQDQIIIPPEMADEVSPAPRKKIRKQIGKPIPQLPFTP
jgi:hypothetical protein